MKISVVVPTSGRWALLRGCLSALAAQTRPADETIVVFDERRAGAAAARNEGIAQASGDVVAFTDDDAAPEPGWLAALASCFDDPAVAGAGGPVEPVWESAPPSWIAVSRKARGCLGLLDLGGARRRLDPEAEYLIGSNCAYRRAVLGGPAFRGVLAQGDAGVCGEDVELSRRVARRGVVIYEPAAVVRHRLDGRRLGRASLLKKAFLYEAVRARLGGGVKPRRSLRDILAREKTLLPAVLLGHLYGRLRSSRPAWLFVAALLVCACRDASPARPALQDPGRLARGVPDVQSPAARVWYLERTPALGAYLVELRGVSPFETRDAWLRLIVVSGRARLRLAGGESVVEAGAYVSLPPGTSYRLEREGKEPARYVALLSPDVQDRTLLERPGR